MSGMGRQERNGVNCVTGKGGFNTGYNIAAADPGIFLGGGTLVSCSTSTPVNHIVFFFAEYQLY